jgi:hypothetical protein
MVAPLGEAALAATTMGALNLFAGMVLPIGVVFIVQSFVAQLRGRAELGRVPCYAWYGLALALGSGLVGVALIPARWSYKRACRRWRARGCWRDGVVGPLSDQLAVAERVSEGHEPLSLPEPRFLGDRPASYVRTSGLASAVQ